ncbi:MAG: sugar phosphate isomerase/epimerase family protein [Luteolibacter sp.]
MNIRPTSTKYSRRGFAQLIGGATFGMACSHRAFAEEVVASPLVTGFGVCTSFADYPHLKGVGFQYVEDNTRRLLRPDVADEVVAGELNRIVQEKIRVHACNGFLPAELKCTGPNPNHEEILKWADVAFKRGGKIGIKGIVFGSGPSRKIPEGFDRKEAEAQFVSLLKKMAPLAEAQGVEIWLEPLRREEVNFINTQIEGAAIVDQVNHPSLGMVCDIFHVISNEEPPEVIEKCIRHIRHCHIAEKEGRQAPGVKLYDFKPYLRALKSGGYSSTMSIECRWKNMEKQAEGALEYLRGQIKEI